MIELCAVWGCKYDVSACSNSIPQLDSTARGAALASDH